MARDTQGTQGTQSQASNIWTQVESQPMEKIVWGRLYGKNIKIKSLGTSSKYRILYTHSSFSVGNQICCLFCVLTCCLLCIVMVSVPPMDFRSQQWRVQRWTRGGQRFDPHAQRFARENPDTHFQSAFYHQAGKLRALQSSLHTRRTSHLTSFSDPLPQKLGHYMYICYRNF